MPEKHSDKLDRIINNDLKEFVREVFEDATVDTYIKTQVAGHCEQARAQLRNTLKCSQDKQSLDKF